MLPAPVDCDVIVLAGDIHQGLDGLRWARERFPAMPIIYVPGNHEFYEHDWDRLPGEMAALARELGIHLLDRGVVVIDSVHFLGCTLWTDFDLFGEARRAEAMEASRKLFDYRFIRCGQALIVPEQTRERHLVERAWLAAQLNETPDASRHATVVVTHMVPSFRSTAERFRAQLSSAGFASHLDTLVEKADLWIHGHTHDSYDYKLSGCRVVCNPRGYRNKGSRFENKDFQESLIVEI